MPFINISNQHKIHYLDPNPGGAPEVLLLHGLGMTGDSWGLQIPALIEAGYRVLAPDARSFGQSTFPKEGTSVAKMAEDMAALLEELQTGPTSVVGISMGGILAQQLALDQPRLVKKLVLVNTFARLPVPTNFHPKGWGAISYFALRFALVHTLGIHTQARAVARRIFPKPEQAELRQILVDQIHQADPRGYRATMRALARFNVIPRLGQIRAQTLVITGEDDNTILPEHQRPLVEGIPGARQVIISGAGHGLVAEQPALFNQILIDFLKNEEVELKKNQ